MSDQSKYPDFVLPSDQPKAAPAQDDSPDFILPSEAAQATPQTASSNPGTLANSADDTNASSIGKGAATAAIQGASDLPGIGGNLRNLEDYLFARVEAAVTGRPVEDVQAEHAAKIANFNANAQKDLGFSMPETPSGDEIAAPILKKTGEYVAQTPLGRAGMMGARIATGSGIGTGAGSIPKAFVAGAAGQAATDATGDPLVGLGVGAAAPEIAGKAGSLVTKPVGNYVAPMIPSARANVASDMLGKAATDPAAALNAVKTAPSEIIPGSRPNLAEQTGDIGLSQATKAAGIAEPGFAASQNVAAGAQNAARTSALDDIAPGAADVMSPTDHLNKQLSAIDQAHQNVIDSINRRASNPALANAQNAIVSGLEQKAGALNSSIPDNFNPDVTGMNLRTALQSAGDAAAEMRSKLYGQVDPNNELAVVASPAADAARQIMQKIDPTVSIPSAHSMPILEMASKLPPVMPFNKLTAFDSTVTNAMKAAKIAGDYTGHAQLGELKSAVMGTINSAVQNQHDWEQAAVSRGDLEPSNTITARMSERGQEPTIGDTGRNASASSVAAVGESPSARTPSMAGQSMEEVPGGGGLRSFAGSEGVQASQPETTSQGQLGPYSSTPGGFGTINTPKTPAEAPAPILKPNFDQSAADRLATAKAAHAAYDRTYRQGPIKEALSTNGFKGQYKAPPSAVVAKAFRAGDTGYAAAKAFLGAAKNSPEAVDALKQIATDRLRSTMKGGNALEPKYLNGWKINHQHALRAIDEASPGFSSSFDNAAGATQALADAKIARDAALKAEADTNATNLKRATSDKVQALKNAQAGAAGKIIGATTPGEVKAQVGTMLRAKDGPTQIQNVLARMTGNPAAVEGLQRAGVEHLIDSVTNQGTVGGEHIISGAKLNGMLKAHEDAIEALLGKQGLDNVKAVAADIERSQKALDNTRARTGSDTAANVFAKLKEVASKAGHISIGGAMTIAGIEAMHSGDWLQAAGIAGAAGAKAALGKLRSNGINKVNDLYLLGLEDPAVGRAMLQSFVDRQGKANVSALPRLAQIVERSGRMIAPLQQSQEDRQARKDGGRVQSHEFLLNRLLRKVEWAKKEENRTTEPLLNMPDPVVVKALQIANRQI